MEMTFKERVVIQDHYCLVEWKNFAFMNEGPCFLTYQIRSEKEDYQLIIQLYNQSRKFT